ncbi:MAG: sigma-70 family RNA polymerase sigma factor [Alloacidobacterium sp.]|jgi:RNA polymerase sigma-70 factor (ECF subfamily)
MNPFIAKRNNTETSTGMKEISDELLVAAARTGDRSAFVELCNRYSKKILPRVYRITKNWEDAEDVLQESLVKAFVHLESFEGRSKFSSWLTSIAINCALMQLRKRHRLDISIDRIQDDSQTWSTWEPEDRAETPENRYARQEREELLRSAILRLPTIFREVVELRHTQEYSTSEIAQALGISVAAVKSRLLRARMAVRSSFAEAAVTS